MRKYIVKVDGCTTKCNLFTYLFARLYRSFRGWSKPHVIGSFSDVS